MRQATVEQILDMIDALPDDDRDSLEQRLAERLEREWRNEAAAALVQAKRRGIDQMGGTA